MATMLRIQPIVATLGTYLDPGGRHPHHPARADRPGAGLAEGDGRVDLDHAARGDLPALVAACAALPYYDQLMAVGSDDRAAYTAGVPRHQVRFLAYVMTGVFAGIAGLMLTALIGSADPNIGADLHADRHRCGGARRRQPRRRHAAGWSARRSARSTSSCSRACSPHSTSRPTSCRSPTARSWSSP